jgi:hypothetical protein
LLLKASDMPAQAGVHHLGHAGGKLPKAFGEFLGCPVDTVQMTNDIFSMIDS